MLQAIAKRHTKCGKRMDRETVTGVIAAFPGTGTSAVFVVDTAVDPRSDSSDDAPRPRIPAHRGPGRRVPHQLTPIITIIITAEVAVVAAQVLTEITGLIVGTAVRNGLSAQRAILEIQWTSGRHVGDQIIPLANDTITTVTHTTKNQDRVDPVHVRPDHWPLIFPILTVTDFFSPLNL